MSPGPQVTPELLREFLDYDPATGAMLWRVRSVVWFQRERDCIRWNRLYAGRAAFATGQGSYLTGRIFKKSFKAHRVVLAWTTGKWPVGPIDHINGVRGDNRLANLREVSPAENSRNACLSSANTSGTSGVYWRSGRRRWLAQISHGGHRVYLGSFAELEAAVAARKAAEARYAYHPNHGRAA